MEERSETRIAAGATMRDGFSALTAPPFRSLLVLGIFVSLVSNTLPENGDTPALAGSLLLLALALYLQVATTVAAAEATPAPSPDVWLKEAFARRCFWRYFATSILVVMIVLLAGVVGLIAGGFFMGGLLALADPAVVLERKSPAEAIARSSRLSKGNRPALAVIFGLLVLLPGLGVQVASLAWDLRALAGPWWPLLPVSVLVAGSAGVIGLTRTFLELGGGNVPVEPRPGRDQGPG